MALDRSFPKRTSAEKAHTSLLRLAVASVTTKAVLRVRSASEHCDLGSKGGFVGYLKITMGYLYGGSIVGRTVPTNFVVTGKVWCECILTGLMFRLVCSCATGGVCEAPPAQ